MNRVPLPTGATKGKSYEYGCDVNLAAPGQPKNYRSIRRMFGFNPTMTPVTSDSRTYDDLGSANQSVDAWDFSLALSTNVIRLFDTGEFLPEIQALVERTWPDAIDVDAEIDVRWYHKPAKGTPNPDEAFEGTVTVSRTRANTGAEGSNEVWNWTLTGVGPATRIENPFGGWDDVAPTVTSALPSGAAAGSQVQITGTGFKDSEGANRVTGAGGVKFGAVNATSYVVNSATLITAVVPTGSAGSAPITVTPTTGSASNAYPYTRA